ncbi:MAG TPA: tRNA threonylcarbamoyladenosine dehydratase [Firmicutes bacterium]|nr:tRNA threonylcarbamoyladenosine dehydratase [Bacillota bacterium]
MADIFSRTRRLIGEEGLAVLGRSRVVIVGLGGVGSFATEALARAGIGHFVLVDFDDVDVTNVNRQLHAFPDTAGIPKVELMRDRVLRINPGARVVALKKFVSGDARKDTTGEIPAGKIPSEEIPAEEIVAGPCDYLVDACDTVATKVALAACCARLGVPIVSSMGAGNRLDPTRFRVADISRTHTCPLARAVRQGLRRIGITSGLTVVFSDEKPRKAYIGVNGGEGGEDRQIHEDGGLGECLDGHAHATTRGPGSISFVPSVAGLILAGVVVNDLLRSHGLEGVDLRDG